MSNGPPPISDEYLDIGRQRIFPDDCFVHTEITESSFPVVAVQQTPSRGVFVKRDSTVAFWVESEVIDKVASEQYQHWRKLAAERHSTDDEDFLICMYATGTAVPQVATGIARLDEDTPSDVSPAVVDEWVVSNQIEFHARSFDAAPEWLRQHPDLAKAIGRLLWKATSAAQNRRFPSLVSETDIDNRSEESSDSINGEN